MFASRSVTVHLLRGAFGFGALLAALWVLESSPGLSVALLVAAVVGLRGCPTCWTFGLIEIMAARARGHSLAAGCVDGSCARASRPAP